MVNSIKKSLKRAFTITELVIVIAVIAILAAVLIPTLSNVVESANKSAALSTCRNALSDLEGIYANNGQTTEDMDGMVFVSNGYVYVFINSGLQYVGELEDLDGVDNTGAIINTEKDTSYYVNYSYGSATAAKISLDVTNNATYYSFSWFGTTIYFDSAKVSGLNSSGVATYTAADMKSYEYQDTDTSHYYLGVDMLEVGSSDVYSATTELSAKTAESLYFYSIELNNTTYVGFFTYETGTALYQTESATYSRLYSYNTATTVTTGDNLLTESD